MDAEQRRLAEARDGTPWRRWGPYLSERQWGTVREDYSANGDAWNYFGFEQSQSRAYRWGEDGLAGISDEKQRLCFALALWNGRDPILKERLFGLTNNQGNHGEDVKEYYFYLDNLPSHAWMRYLYRYPQAPFPYADLVATNGHRNRQELEYELVDTGVFDGDRYWDVFVDYAKASPEDILVRIRAHNRGPEAATLQLLPTLWFRNTWSWDAAGPPQPSLSRAPGGPGHVAIAARHADLGAYRLACRGEPALLFTENETNHQRLFGGQNATPYVKDGIGECLVAGNRAAVNPAQTGTKAAAHYILELAPGGAAEIWLRLTAEDQALGAEGWPGEGGDPFGAEGGSHAGGDPFGPGFAATLAAREAEADRFYDLLTPPAASADEAVVLRQALAGLLWSKQYYSFDLDRWLAEHGAHPLRNLPQGHVRNQDWFHMVNSDVISMPDKWEYPWYAAWDLAFHAIAVSMADMDFAKEQLDLMLRSNYLHPNGQLPAYEWNFGDVNPPVHAWATVFLHYLEVQLTGRKDMAFLRRQFHKLNLNFTWWVNRKDFNGRNAFQGGFLGLDNIGVFDRSAPLPTGGYLEQADGTAWMALFSLTMLELACELALDDPNYVDMAAKYLRHFFLIAGALDRMGESHDELWDEEDGFYYDLLRLPDGSAHRLKVRSMVGLLPICTTTAVSGAALAEVPELAEALKQVLVRDPDLLATVADPRVPGVAGRRLLSPLDATKLRRLLARMLDEEEFLGRYGIRSLSRYHLEHPFELNVHGEVFRVGYLPAESDSGMFGSNSNWRGPIWFPVNVLIIRGLLQAYTYYGDDFKVECPTGSGHAMTLFEVAREIAHRLIAIFTRGPDGRRPVFGGAEHWQSDPQWRDHLLFYEYFHGDNGAGIGASHQTGWTALVAPLIQIFASVTPEALLAGGVTAALSYVEEPAGGDAGELGGAGPVDTPEGGG